MNKDLASELIKVANVLDEMGLNKEASSLDKIARKVVVSYVITPTGNYKTDIENYKSIISDFQTKTDTLEKQKLAQYATDFLKGIRQSGHYDIETKTVFLTQAKSIRNEIYGGLDSAKLNDTLYSLLIKNSMIDKDQNVLMNLDDFRNNWKEKILPKFDMNNPSLVKWLVNKFNTVTYNLQHQKKHENDPRYNPYVEYPMR